MTNSKAEVKGSEQHGSLETTTRDGRAESVLAPPDPFHHLVQSLSDVLGPSSGIDSSEINPSDLIQLMEVYESNKDDWEEYALSDLSRNYTRNLVDEGNGKSNLLILVWNPGQGSQIHDHADAHCVMKILEGSLVETLYETPEKIPERGVPAILVKLFDDSDGKGGQEMGLITAAEEHVSPQDSPLLSSTANSSSSSLPPSSQFSSSTSFSASQQQQLNNVQTAAPVVVRQTTYSTDAVTYISDRIGLHKIRNPSPTQRAVSLHLYTPPHAANFGFHLFDECTGKRVHIRQAGVYSDRGVKVVTDRQTD